MELQDLAPKRERMFSLDLVRVIAVLAVVMIHVSAPYIQFHQGTNAFLVANIFDSIVRFGVPLFVMVSGALMLDEQKKLTTKRILTKNVTNIVLLFVFWSVVYAVFSLILLPSYYGIYNGFDFTAFYQRIITGEYHMWYLYMIVGMYLITPILRAFVKKENKHIVAYFLCIAVLIQFIRPILNVFSFRYFDLAMLHKAFDSLQLYFISGYVVYYLLGWYLVNVGLTRRLRIALYIAGGCSLPLIIVLTHFFQDKYYYLYTELNVLVLLYSAALFDLIVQFYKGGPRRNRFIQTLSGLAFGVYIIHIIMLEVFNMILPEGTIPVLPIYMLVKWVTVSVASFGVTYLLSKIPYVKKIIRG